MSLSRRVENAEQAVLPRGDDGPPAVFVHVIDGSGDDPSPAEIAGYLVNGERIIARLDGESIESFKARAIQAARRGLRRNTVPVLIDNSIIGARENIHAWEALNA